jgi:hypothetical protein
VKQGEFVAGLASAQQDGNLLAKSAQHRALARQSDCRLDFDSSDIHAKHKLPQFSGAATALEPRAARAT